MRAFPKPCELENVVSLNPAQRAHKRQELFHKQRGRCGYCGRKMSQEHDRMDSCTLEHKNPRPMGCKKQDADFNLMAVCFTCNSKKGSKRL